MIKSAIQLYSIRDMMALDVFSTLKTVAEAGYTGVEFAGYFGVSHKDMRAALDEYGLVTAGTHTGIDALSDENIEATIEYNLAIGNENLVVPGLPREMTESPEAYKRTAELFGKLGERLAKDKIMLYYHNHAHEFTPYGDGYLIDIFFENTCPETLRMQLDTYWAAYAGVDSVAVMKKYGTRCDLLHLKDMLPREDKRCTELGRGIMPLNDIIAQGKVNGVKWYIMEQEDFDIPEIESITVSAKFLRDNL
ncbi:MAG: sugar phosphate isomerase/epimerase [Clostridiales bacterium]|nr:sugar phosphate isomerase/epimerase [Clostridiales bacterium]